MTSPEQASEPPANPDGTTVYISIGSNIEPERNLRAALAHLRALPATTGMLLALSAVYQSPAYGFQDQPDFLDVVARLSTPLTPSVFKAEVLDAIERACGRDRASQLHKDGPLPLDMDILLWGEGAFSFGRKPWVVPNKGIVKYAAVAIPLAELAPDLRHPVEGVTLREIAARFADAADVRRVDLRLED